MKRILAMAMVMGVLAVSLPAMGILLDSTPLLRPAVDCWWTTFYTDTDYLSRTGAAISYRGTFSARVRYRVQLTVPTGADFDVYIYDGNGNLVASGELWGSANETVYFTPRWTGTFRIRVVSYRGSGFFTLRVARCS